MVWAGRGQKWAHLYLDHCVLHFRALVWKHAAGLDESCIAVLNVPVEPDHRPEVKVPRSYLPGGATGGEAGRQEEGRRGGREGGEGQVCLHGSSEVSVQEGGLHGRSFEQMGHGQVSSSREP
jgi:hypothetical protein